MAANKPETTIETITPAKAEKYLESNTKNRSIRKHKVNLYAQIMKQGKWQLTHQGIAFNGDGALLDGQHRLRAIVEAGLPIKMAVTRGLPRDSMYGIDQGVSRNGPDVAHSLGLEFGQSKVWFSVARSMLGGMNQAFTYGVAFTIEELIAFISQHQEAIQFAIALRLGICNTSIIRAVLARAWYTQNHERLAMFAKALETGLIEDKIESAAIAFRNFYVKSGSGCSGINVRTSLYAKTEAALRAFLRGDPITRVMEIEKEQYPIPGETD